MQVTVSSRHTDVPESLRSMAEEKIGRLDRFLDGMDRAEVHFSQERNPRITEREICEVTLEGHGHYVRCKVHAPDGFVAIDRAVAKLEHQLHKLKTKLKRRNHAAARVVANVPADAEPVAVATDDRRRRGPHREVEALRHDADDARGGGPADGPARARLLLLHQPRHPSRGGGLPPGRW